MTRRDGGVIECVAWTVFSQFVIRHGAQHLSEHSINSEVEHCSRDERVQELKVGNIGKVGQGGEGNWGQNEAEGEKVLPREAEAKPWKREVGSSRNQPWLQDLRGLGTFPAEHHPTFQSELESQVALLQGGQC